MPSVGSTLRAERLRRGLNLEQIAIETKIHLHILQAIEEDQFDHIPGGAYRRSFLRQYAHTLGVNEDEAIASFKEQFVEPAVSLPNPPSKRHSKHSPYVWALAAALTGAVIYNLRHELPVVGPSNDSDAGFAAHAAKHADRTIKPAEVAHDAPEKSAPQPVTAMGSGASKAPPAPEQKAGGEPASPNAARNVSVAFVPSEPVWVSVKCDETQVYAGTIASPQNKECGASSKMFVLVGNAGGLEISVNGKPLGPIGAHGEIRLLELTRDGVRVVPRRPVLRPAPTPDAPL